MEQTTEKLGELVELKGKKYFLKYNAPEEFDFDQISQIHYGNIMGELITMPKIINDLGIMLAEIEEYVKILNYEQSLEKDNLAEIKAKLYPKSKDYLMTEKLIKSPTKDEIESHLILDEDYKKQQTKIRELTLEIIRIEGQKERVKTTYWAASSKLDNVKVIANIKPNEVNLIEGAINGVMISLMKGF